MKTKNLTILEQYEKKIGRKINKEEKRMLYITPIKTYTDAAGSWFVEFNRKELKELLAKYKKQKKQYNDNSKTS